MTNNPIAEAYYACISKLWGRSDIYVDAVIEDIEATCGDPHKAGAIYLIRDPSTYSHDHAQNVVKAYNELDYLAHDTMTTVNLSDHILGHNSSPDDQPGVRVATEYPSDSSFYTTVYDPAKHVPI